MAISCVLLPLDSFRITGVSVFESVKHLLAVFFGIGSIVYFLICFLFKKVFLRKKEAISYVLLCYSTLVFIFDAIFIQVLSSPLRFLSGSLFVLIFEFFLFFLILWFLIRYSKEVGAKARLLGVLIIVAAAGEIAFNSERRIEKGIQIFEVDSKKKERERLPNIYFFGFDQISHEEYQSLLLDHETDSQFIDFTQAYANYCYTGPSLHSLLSGEVFSVENIENYESLRVENHDRYLPNMLKSLGYKNFAFTSAYLDKPDYYWHLIAKETGDSTGGIPFIFTIHNAIFAFDFGLGRLVPRLFLQRTFETGLGRGGIFSTFFGAMGQERFYSPITEMSLSHVPTLRSYFRSYIQDSGIPEFHFIFNRVAHRPFVYDRNCELKNSFFSVNDRIESMKCGGVLLKEFIKRLQRLGLFESSLIVLFSDHGLDRERDRVLFKVKMPGDPGTKTIKKVDSLVQLADVRELIWEIVKREKGISRFLETIEKRDSIDVYTCDFLSKNQKRYKVHDGQADRYPTRTVR